MCHLASQGGILFKGLAVFKFYIFPANYTYTQVIRIVLLLLATTFSANLVAQKFIYDLGQPTEVFKLHEDLEEISGLSYYNGRLYAVQDEKGWIFALNPVTGKVMERSKFWGKGDFEGIEVFNDHIYVLKSNGNIYKSAIDDIDEEKTVKYDLGFGDKWNFEAIGYDSTFKRIYICAKRSSNDQRKEIFARSEEDPLAIYQPFHIIDQAFMWSELKKNKKRWTERVAHNIASINYSFNPSAIAVHPVNGEIYVLSHPVPQLAIYSPDWTLRKIITLDSGSFIQPESICFDEIGNLYIANEGRGSKATISKYVPIE